MLPRDDLSSLLLEATSFPLQHPSAGALIPCTRAFPCAWEPFALSCGRTSFPECGKWQLSLYLLLPCCFCFNLLCILAIPSADSEQHQKRLTARKTQAEGSSQGAAIKDGGMLSAKRGWRDVTLSSLSLSRNDRHSERREVFPYKLWVVVTVWCINRWQHFSVEYC